MTRKRIPRRTFSEAEWAACRWGLAPGEPRPDSRARLEVRLDELPLGPEEEVAPGAAFVLPPQLIAADSSLLEILEGGAVIARLPLDPWRPDANERAGWPPPGGRYLVLDAAVSADAFSLQLTGSIYASTEQAYARAGTAAPRELVVFAPQYLGKHRAEKERRYRHGLGAFARGLWDERHPPLDGVRFACACDECAAPLTLRAFDTRAPQLEAAYCDGGQHLCLFRSPTPLASAGPLALVQAEAQLPPCDECGGGFRCKNPLRCPRCRAPFVDFAARPAMRGRETLALYPVGTRGPQRLGL